MALPTGAPGRRELRHHAGKVPFPPDAKELNSEAQRPQRPEGWGDDARGEGVLQSVSEALSWYWQLYPPGRLTQTGHTG